MTDVDRLNDLADLQYTIYVFQYKDKAKLP